MVIIFCEFSKLVEIYTLRRKFENFDGAKDCPKFKISILKKLLEMLLLVKQSEKISHCETIYNIIAPPTHYPKWRFLECFAPIESHKTFLKMETI